MATKWLAIVSRTEARIFDFVSMQKIFTLKNSLGREKNRAFTTDKPGVGKTKTQSRNSTFTLTAEKSPHDDVARQFAHTLNTYLQKQFYEHRFDELIVTAEPRMQGWLKKGMERDLKNHVRWESKDFAKFSDQKLKDLFLDRLESG